MPEHRLAAGDGQAVVVEGDLGTHPRRAARAGRRRPGWSRAASPGRAPGRRWSSRASGTARRWRGRARSSRRSRGSWTGPRSSVSRPRLDLDAVLAQAGDGHLDVRERRHRRTLVAHGHPLVVPRPGEQQRGDELARRRRRRSRPSPPRTPPGAGDGERAGCRGRRRRSSTPSPRRASRTADIGRVRACGSPSKATAPSASAATGGTNRITVPARPQSTVAAVQRGRGDQPVVRRGVDGRAQRGQRRGHQLGVARAQRTAYDGRAVGQRRQHQRAVGQRLGAGQLDARVDRVVRDRRRPQALGVSRGRVLPRTRGYWPSDFAASLACELGLATRGGLPRGARRSRRASPARPPRGDPRCRPRRGAAHRASRGS